jgi:hypothetical protein
VQSKPICLRIIAASRNPVPPLPAKHPVSKLSMSYVEIAVQIIEIVKAVIPLLHFFGKWARHCINWLSRPTKQVPNKNRNQKVIRSTCTESGIVLLELENGEVLLANC